MPGHATSSRLRVTAEAPAHARLPAARLLGDEQPPPPRRLSGLLALTWVLGLVALAVTLAVLRTHPAPARVDQAAAAALGVLATLGLAARSGGRLLGPTLLAVAVGAAAVLTQWGPALAGAALATGVVVTCLAVLGTTPAPGYGSASREVVLAHVVAGAGALAVEAFHVDLELKRFAYAVLGLALLGTLALVHRLGGGLHGLGRRGVLLTTGMLVLLVLVLAYAVALGRWGPAGMTEELDAVRAWSLDHLGAVPRPIVVLLGVPALAWGVSVRGRRRQGWWLCAYGAAGTAATATSLADPGTTGREALLGTAYALALGLVLGYAVVRLARLLSSSRGRRTRRDEEVRRPEPRRLRPLH